MRTIRHTALTAALNAAALQRPIRDDESRGFRASKLASCMRQRVYYLLGIPATDAVYDPDYEKAALQGDLLHLMIQDELRMAGMLYTFPDGTPAKEVPLAGHAIPELAQYNFSGTLDAVILQPDESLAILDIKTISVEYLQRASPIWPKKLAGYEVQLQAYMHFFRTPEGEQIRDAYIYVIARDNTKRRRLLHLEYSAALMGLQLERLRDAEEHRARGVLPAPEPSSACRFCAYQQACPAMATTEDEEPLPWEEAS